MNEEVMKTFFREHVYEICSVIPMPKNANSFDSTKYE